MSLFSELEILSDAFQPNDNDTTKKTIYDYNTVDFTVYVNVITLNDTEIVLFQQEMATNKANIKGDNASQLQKGTRLQVVDKIYEITNTPVERKLFVNTYTCRLRRVNK